MYYQFASILLLGLLGGANPGPILVSAFTESLEKGFGKSLAVIFKALLAETIAVMLALILLSAINIPLAFFYFASIIGSFILIWIGIQVWKIERIGNTKEIFTFKKIFVLTIFNGPFWMFWITVCVPQAFLLKEKIFGGQFIFLAFFELGWLIATGALTWVFSRFRNVLMRGRNINWIFKFFSVLLFLFAAKLLVQSVGFLVKTYF